MFQITTLQTRQVLFLCAWFYKCILAHVGTARTSVWAGQLRKLSFLCQYSTNWGLYCLNWLELPPKLIGCPNEKWRIFPLTKTHQSMQNTAKAGHEATFSLSQFTSPWTGSSLPAYCAKESQQTNQNPKTNKKDFPSQLWSHMIAWLINFPVSLSKHNPNFRC